MGVVGVALGTTGQQRHRREEMNISHQPGRQTAYIAAEPQRFSIPSSSKLPFGPERAAIPAKIKTMTLPATPRGLGWILDG